MWRLSNGRNEGTVESELGDSFIVVCAKRQPWKGRDDR